MPTQRDLLAHEFTHSWNGKFRRPADLWTPNYNVPMRGSLLWVYEGQTQYWGYVLAARSGLLTKQQALDALGFDGGDLRFTASAGSGVPCRTPPTIRSPRSAGRWRGGAGSAARTTTPKVSWSGSTSTRLIRERSGRPANRSTISRAPSSASNDGSYVPVTYTFEDVVKALNAVAAVRLGGVSARAARRPWAGRAARRPGARRLQARCTRDTPTDYFRSSEVRRQVTDLTYSLGWCSPEMAG